MTKPKQSVMANEQYKEMAMGRLQTAISAMFEHFWQKEVIEPKNTPKEEDTMKNFLSEGDDVYVVYLAVTPNNKLFGKLIKDKIASIEPRSENVKLTTMGDTEFLPSNVFKSKQEAIKHWKQEWDLPVVDTTIPQKKSFKTRRKYK